MKIFKIVLIFIFLIQFFNQHYFQESLLKKSILFIKENYFKTIFDNTIKTELKKIFYIIEIFDMNFYYFYFHHKHGFLFFKFI